jgi:hypothetical protein
MGIIYWLFGEAGKNAALWVRDNILWFAVPILIFAIFYRYDPKNRLKNWLAELHKKWRKTRFAIPEADRKLIDSYKIRAKQNYEARKKK